MTGILQNLDQLEAAFARDGVDPATYAETIARTRDHLRRYAELETTLLGHVSFPVPHDVLRPLPEDFDPEEVEELAARQRDRLRKEDPSTGDLMTALDRDGLKVYRPPFPDGPVRGFFLFDQGVGPVMVVDAALPPPEANAVFARLLGHYLIDSNPYRICLFRETGGPGPAVAFGAAFLIGKRVLEAYLAALLQASPARRETVEQLAAYFESSPDLVIDRLVALGLVSAEEADALRGTEGAFDTPNGHPVVSERFMRLALEAHARGNLTMRELSEYLETDESVAGNLAARFRLVPLDSGDSRG